MSVIKMINHNFHFSIYYIHDLSVSLYMTVPVSRQTCDTVSLASVKVGGMIGRAVSGNRERGPLLAYAGLGVIPQEIFGNYSPSRRT